MYMYMMTYNCDMLHPFDWRHPLKSHSNLNHASELVKLTNVVFSALALHCSNAMSTVH